MQKVHGKQFLFFILLLTCVTLFSRFYNLNWGAPDYFHPDERNIIYSVTGLHYPEQLNPHFFAYGSLPIYLIYVLGVGVNCIIALFSSHTVSLAVFTVTFTPALLISRFISAVYSVLLVLVTFYIGVRLKDYTVGLLAATFACLSVGFIQFAHFGTFEMWLTFYGVLLFWMCLKMLNNSKRIYRILAAVIFGILISVKVSSLVLLPLPLVIIILTEFIKNQKYKKIHLRIIKTFREILLFFIISSAVYILTNPFVFLDYKDFIGSMHYESSVALGTEPVFYTGGFIHTIPIVFQFISVYPFLLNPFITILFIFSFFYLIYICIKKRSAELILLLAFYALLFFSQAWFYVKWTRYMMPTLPFMYLIIVKSLTDWFGRATNHLRIGMYSMLILICFVFSLSFIITVYYEPDSRIMASQFASQHIPTSAHIVSEVYDLGILPFNPLFPSITLFNFYDLDNNSPQSTPSTLSTLLDQTQYIILPSQRILKSRLLHPKDFPNGYAFYNSLFSGKLGYRLIYETPCDIFCKIIYLGNPVFRFEETANVFDRPTVFIFQK